MRLRTVLATALFVAALAGCSSDRPKPPAPTGTSAVPADEVAAERAKLSPDDRALVDAQEWCAVSAEERLGAMGPPLKLDLNGQPVFVCCKGCKRKTEADPEKTLKAAADLKAKKAVGGSQ